jgi:hypothetical protein
MNKLTFTIITFCIISFIRTNAQSDFSTKKITIFKTGVAQFEKESNGNVVNNNLYYTKLPFSGNEEPSNNFDNNNPQTNTNIVLGTVNFNAINNTIKEVRVQPDNLKLVLSKNNSKQKINVTYLQNGLMWIPQYDIKLLNNKGIVTLSATILNDVEDIENVDLRLAVGYPNFPYSTIASPLANKTTVSKMLETLKHRENRSPNYNETIVVGYGAAKNSSLNNKKLAVKKQSNSENLFFYEKPGFSIRKNEITKISLLDFEVDYKNVYSTTLNNSKQIINYNGILTSGKEKSKVKHSVQFKNISDHPLTSGITYIQKIIDNEVKYIYQGAIEHTLVNKNVINELSITPDVVVNDFDSIKERIVVNNDKGFIINGEVEVVNHKRDEITIEVNREIYGELIESEADWKIKSLPVSHSTYNTINTVKWEVKVAPNSKKKFKYQYKVIFTK